MSLLPLVWQLPAIFTAVPMVSRLLPFKLAARAIPVFYFTVSLIVMAMPGRVDLALAAAGLISMLHLRLGENLTSTEPLDIKEVGNALFLAWDYIVTRLQELPVSRVKASKVHESPEDVKPKDDSYQEPPRPPADKKLDRIPRL